MAERICIIFQWKCEHSGNYESENELRKCYVSLRVSNDFENWRQQVEVLRNTYQLDDNAAKVLINLRLKGKALRWCQSKPSHLAMPATELLEVMKGVFDHRPSKLALRREMEARTWRRNETFCDYYIEKLTLANQINVDAEELVTWVVAGSEVG